MYVVNVQTLVMPVWIERWGWDLQRCVQPYCFFATYTTKVTHSEQLPAGILQGSSSQETIPADMLTMDSTDLIALLSEDLAGDNAVSHSEIENIDEGSDRRNNDLLTEDEDKVRSLANRIVHDAPQVPGIAQTICGRMIEISQEASSDLLNYTKKMRVEKTLKRPVTNDPHEEQSRKWQRSVENPTILVDEILDHIQFSNVEYNYMLLDKQLQIVDSVHSQFLLDENEEQLRAFHLVAQHFMMNSVDQMLMFVIGMGGSGKSHVIKAIIELFRWCGCLENLLLSAPTGCAAILIDGYTIHALTYLPGKLTSNNRHELENIWGNIRYLVLDEISMVSAELLCNISERISIGKGFEAYLRDKPFGGVNLIFAGDLCQL